MEPYTRRGGHHSQPNHTPWGSDYWQDRLSLLATAHWSQSQAPPPYSLSLAVARSSHWCPATATDLIADLGQQPVGLLHQVELLRLHRSQLGRREH